MKKIVWFSLALLSIGCVEETAFEVTLSSFHVTLNEGIERGSESAPLPYATGRSCGEEGLTCDQGETCEGGQCSTTVTVDIEALTSRGTRATGFNGPVRLDVTPGNVPGQAAIVQLEDGVKKGVQVSLNRAMGKTHIWVEQDGYTPKPASVQYGQCNDGKDNDGNGLIDLADPGCLDKTDNLEQVVSLATGASETLTFSYPTIREIQYTETSLASTPLQYEQVTVPGGRKVVVNVVANGFYVVDLDDQTNTGGFNGIFVFTFSKPQGVKYGDIVCQFSGGLEEHVGMSQVVFPSFVIRDPNQPACLVDENVSTLVPPTPFDVTAAMDPDDDTKPLLLDEFVEDGKTARDNHTANCKTLEALESNLVTFSDVEVSTRFVACDANENGIIDGGDENTCRSVCQEDPLCTDLEGYFEYSQYAGLTGGRKKIYGSVALAEKFKPLAIDYIGQKDQNGLCTFTKTPEGFSEYQCPERTLDSLTGTLKHIHLCGPSPTDASCGLQFWVIDPRFNGDVVISENADVDEEPSDNDDIQTPEDAEEDATEGTDDNSNGEIDDEE